MSSLSGLQQKETCNDGVVTPSGVKLRRHWPQKSLISSRRQGLRAGSTKKVNDIQDSYNKAADLKRQSGEGILDEDEAKTFHDKLFGICKHWYVLDPVFHNRSSSRPIAPNGTFKNAPPFVITSARENTEDGNFDLDHPDLFSFGENAFRTVKTTPKQMR
ncbi:hypothetical protein PF005_g24862 [Phytophthora fragariae]|uniref:Uncharacterized protein n=1 Tax=Phytophthora fragariae TaxID=53985 RepID=A0A6A3W0A3_9STRA|nr:hypothetical protein PF009_g25673 [Phytophthora fragariae]KAE9075772.1 hypothetical protein PF007_g24875 [Phytophthora fragariae]KAE9092881.1 hypothetical protein PF006_g24582 [Phytophthora fragariae]KAE9176598.1 hypothetical protein PF005_g24862 [Phytophthora fragariae]